MSNSCKDSKLHCIPTPVYPCWAQAMLCCCRQDKQSAQRLGLLTEAHNPLYASSDFFQSPLQCYERQVWGFTLKLLGISGINPKLSQR